MGEAPGFLYILKAEGAVSGSLSEFEFSLGLDQRC